MAASAAATRASTVASIFGVGVYVAVGIAAATAVRTLASMSGVGRGVGLSSAQATANSIARASMNARQTMVFIPLRSRRRWGSVTSEAWISALIPRIRSEPMRLSQHGQYIRGWAHLKGSYASPGRSSEQSCVWYETRSNQKVFNGMQERHQQSRANRRRGGGQRVHDASDCDRAGTNAAACRVRKMCVCVYAKSTTYII